MSYTILQRAFAPFKKALPAWLWSPIRRIATAVITPLLFSYRSGHWRSSLRGLSLDRHGRPLPWYTYPCIEFLRVRDYTERTIVEFGAGQSTLWWAARAKRVIALEGDPQWFERIAQHMPHNVDLRLVSVKSPSECMADVNRVLAEIGISSCDVSIIDGLWRAEMAGIALRLRTTDGLIICDNAEGYGFQEAFSASELGRVDFFGNAPGVVLAHSTSIYFGSRCFAFDPKLPIPVISKLD